MVAADTNLLVRLLTEDDRKQAGWARELFRLETVWIAKTVLLETAWVLKSAYGHRTGEVVEALESLCSLPNVELEDELRVRAAMALAAKGLDLADAMHLCSRPPGVAFVTFDRRFARRAERAGVEEVKDVSRKVE